MKRFIAIMFAAVIFSATAAQAQIIHVKSTTITTAKQEKPKRERPVKEEKPKPEKPPKEEKPKRERPVLPPQHGFQSDVRLGVMSLGYYDQTTVEATYTAGYRFNNMLYVGAGIGVNYNTWSGQYVDGYEGQHYEQVGIPSAAFTVPLFAQIRVYFLKKRISPFVDATAGVMLTSSGEVEYGRESMKDWNPKTAKYGRSMGYGTLSLGVNCRITNKSSVYLLVGGKLYGARVMQADEPFLIYNKYFMPASLNIGTRTSFGLYTAIGFTF